MRVQMNRQFGVLFDFRDQIKNRLGNQETRHVFNADDIRPHVLQPFGHLDVQLDVVDRADGVADGPFDGFLAFFYCVHRRFNIAKVIQRVKNPEDVHAFVCRVFDKTLNDIVGVMPVAHTVLPAQ